MCGLEVSALGQCGNLKKFSELDCLFLFPEAIEGLTCNEQLLGA